MTTMTILVMLTKLLLLILGLVYRMMEGMWLYHNSMGCSLAWQVRGAQLTPPWGLKSFKIYKAKMMEKWMKWKLGGSFHRR